MKKTLPLIAGLAVLLLIQAALAVPAEPKTFNLVQPDNSVFLTHQRGDERAAWMETIDGYSVVKDANGWWTFAELKNGQLIASSKRVKVSKPKGLTKHLKPHLSGAPVMQKKGTAALVPTSGGAPPSGKGLSPPQRAPKVGTEEVIVILINFTDQSQGGSHTPAYYDDLVFNTSASANSMYNYYQDVSFDQLNITGNVSGNKWYQSNKTLAYYGSDGCGSIDTGASGNCVYVFDLAREALKLADADINFSDYDTNSNGVLNSDELHIIVVHAGAGQESSGTATDIWSHKWEVFGSNYDCKPGAGSQACEDTTLDGVRISRNNGAEDIAGYTMLAEGSPLGTFAHEFGHDLGLPDLYDTDYSSKGIGDWGVMAHGSWNGVPAGSSPAHFCAWSKYFLGWINPQQVNNSIGEQVNQSETNDDVYMLLDNPSDSPGNLDWSDSGGGTGEYFLVENRQKTGYDAYLPGAGLLIWHIDETRLNNDADNRRLVDLEEADGAMTGYGDGGDPWKNSSTGFTPTSNPDSNLYNSSISKVTVTNISVSGSSMTANFVIDNILPVITLISPTNGSAFAPGEIINLTVTDNVEVNSVWYSKNSGANQSLSSPYNIDTSSWTRGAVNLVVWANDTSSNTNSSVYSFTVNNTAPEASNLSIQPTSPTSSDNLTCAYDYSDSDGDAESGTVIKWFINSVENSSLENSTTVGSGNTTRGENWMCAVIPSDGTDVGSQVNSSSVSIQNSPPTISDVNLNPSAPDTDDVVSCSPVGSYDADGDNVTHNYQWYLNGSSISGANTSSYNCGNPGCDKGDTLMCEITPNDGTVDGQPKNNSAMIGNLGPSITLTDPTGGENWSGTKAITWTASDPDNDTLSITLKYSTDGVAWTTIASGEANDGTYSWDTTSVNDGSTYRVKVIASDGYLTDEDQSITFTIDNPHAPVINLIAPTGGERWLGTKTIEWNATDADGETITITIEYSPNSGTTWYTIINDTANDGEHDWNTENVSDGNKYKIKVTAEDTTSRTDSDTSSLFRIDNVADTSNGGTGGGSGGGYPTSTETTTFSHTFDTIETGETATWKISDIAIALDEIDIAVKSGVNNVKLTAKKHSSRPSSISEPDGNVYQYLDISAQNLADSDINQVTIKFKVEKSWLTKNEFSEDDIVLKRYKDGGWTALTTYKLNTDSTHVQYSATSPGFSIFAIVAEQELEQVTGKQTEEGITAPKTQEKKKSIKLTGSAIKEFFTAETHDIPRWLWTLVIIVVVLAVGVILSGEKKRPRPRYYYPQRYRQRPQPRPKYSYPYPTSRPQYRAPKYNSSHSRWLRIPRKEERLDLGFY